MRRFNACLRGALVTALVWAPLGGIAWLTLRTLTEQGSLTAAHDVRAMRMGVFAFAVFVASALGALVAGHGLVDSYVPRVLVTFLLATLAPLPICAAAVAFGNATHSGDSAMWVSLLAAALVGGAGGGFVSALRERAEEESFYERAAARREPRTQGWRSA